MIYLYRSALCFNGSLSSFVSLECWHSNRLWGADVFPLFFEDKYGILTYQIMNIQQIINITSQNCIFLNICFKIRSCIIYAVGKTLLRKPKMKHSWYFSRFSVICCSYGISFPLCRPKCNKVERKIGLLSVVLHLYFFCLY